MPDSTKPNNESSIILRSTHESSKKSERGLEHLDWINDQITIMAEAFAEKLTEERQEIYCAGLADIARERLEVAFRRVRYELKWFPKIAELRELAGQLPGNIDDGRPGPEEAWARMPKSEEESIVWCEEERVAYGACRSLLRDGDLIAARMAFKERYEKELALARSESRPAQWDVSLGYDLDHRLTTLATAVHENLLKLDVALDLIPGERRDDFARMLPPSLTIGLLAGATEKSPIEKRADEKILVEKNPLLQGLPALLAGMRMEDVLPENVRAMPAQPGDPAPERTREEWRQLKQKARAQVEFLKQTRRGNGVH